MDVGGVGTTGIVESRWQNFQIGMSFPSSFFFDARFQSSLDDDIFNIIIASLDHSTIFYPTKTRSKKCQDRAYDAITGEGGYLCHGYFNYQYYAQSVFKTENNVDGTTTTVIPENANLLVIRNDHIVDDWNVINVMIGGEPDSIQSSDAPMNNVSPKTKKWNVMPHPSCLALSMDGYTTSSCVSGPCQERHGDVSKRQFQNHFMSSPMQ